MLCEACNVACQKFGKDRYGNQRYRCAGCRRTYSVRPARPLDAMRIPLDKALAVLRCLVEGNSVRSTMRIAGVNRTTILSLLILMGERCERLIAERVRSLAVTDVQCDEIWGYVGMKERTRNRRELEPDGIGDAYCYVGLERTSKLVLAWHLGRRNFEDAYLFADKLCDATRGRFQITTDGFAAYRNAIPAAMAGEVDFAQLVKHYTNEREREQRYSPGEVTGVEKVPCCGNPNPDRICTSHVERQNLTMRMGIRRLTRLTNAFSKKWTNHRMALALHFAYYNFCRKHQTLKRTPAQAAGLEDHQWTLEELVEKSTQS